MSKFGKIVQTHTHTQAFGHRTRHHMKRWREVPSQRMATQTHVTTNMCIFTNHLEHPNMDTFTFSQPKHVATHAKDWSNLFIQLICFPVLFVYIIKRTISKTIFFSNWKRNAIEKINCNVITNCVFGRWNCHGGESVER